MTYTEFTLSIDLGIVGVTIRDKKAIAHPSFCHRVALKYVIWTAFFWHFAFEYVLMCAHIYMLCCAVAIPHLRFCFENRLSNYIRNAEVIRRHAQNCKSKNKMNTNNTVDAHIEWWYHSAFISLIWPIGCRNGCTSILYSVFCIQSNYKSASHRPHVFGWERARTHKKKYTHERKNSGKKTQKKKKEKKSDANQYIVEQQESAYRSIGSKHHSTSHYIEEKRYRYRRDNKHTEDYYEEMRERERTLARPQNKNIHRSTNRFDKNWQFVYVSVVFVPILRLQT